MSRTMTVLFAAGVLAIGAGACSKKQTPDAQGSLLSGSSSSGEDKKDEPTVQDSDITNQRGSDMPQKRLPR